MGLEVVEVEVVSPEEAKARPWVGMSVLECSNRRFSYLLKKGLYVDGELMYFPLDYLLGFCFVKMNFY